MHKILVVDDDLEIVKILEELLTKKGFDVVTTVGGAKALEIIHSDVFDTLDLIVLDMKMPGLNGTDILKELKRIKSQIPFIILTGAIDAQKQKDELEKLGCSLDDVNYKPIDLFQFLNMVKKKLSRESK